MLKLVKCIVRKREALYCFREARIGPQKFPPLQGRGKRVKVKRNRTINSWIEYNPCKIMKSSRRYNRNFTVYFKEESALRLSAQYLKNYLFTCLDLIHKNFCTRKQICCVLYTFLGIAISERYNKAYT